MLQSELSRRQVLSVMVAGALFCALPTIAMAAEVNLAGNGIAIKGFDPVAYFTQGKPVRGSSKFTATHDGAVYQFASAQHRDLFMQSPTKYAPVYGGFCAYAVSQGYLAPIDPEAFTVANDKLYLNYSKGVRSRWTRNQSDYIASGDRNWPSLAAQ